ncbi:MAG TPA: hypothetical protein VHL58_06525 [Thermoanaerobaculia bacterium]|nr:hypothetical protein [Thermoanaerobaculia bacterium]
MKIRNLRSAALIASLLLAAVAGQAAVQDKNAGEVASGASRIEARAELVKATRIVRLPVSVDLTRVTIFGKGATLGGYVARIEFDPSSVELVGVKGGSSKGFAAEPFATNTTKANHDGVLKLTAVNTEDLTASGMVSVANVEFREIEAGGRSSIQVSLESVASMLMRDASGEAKLYAIKASDVE